MIYPILKYGHPTLGEKSQPVTEFNKKLKKLVEDMWETMYAANGVGLAAPQIGISQSLCVIDTTVSDKEGSKVFMANPVIVKTEGKHSEEEGCLSLPDFRALTPRSTRVTVRAQDLTGKEFTLTGEGLLARAFQHETDHLNGILYIHRLSMIKRESIKRKVRQKIKANEW